MVVLVCRAINLYPHRYVGVVGRHMKYGVEGISISCDQKYLASCCQTDTVQFWDLQHLYGTETDERKKVLSRKCQLVIYNIHQCFTTVGHAPHWGKLNIFL